MTYSGLQPRLRNSANPAARRIGEIGCYFLSICQLAGLELGDTYESLLLNLWKDAVNHAWINAKDEITDAAGILSALSGKKYTVEKIDRPLIPAPTGDAIIYKYHAYSGDGFHYKTADCDTEVSRDRLLAGYRIFTNI